MQHSDNIRSTWVSIGDMLDNCFWLILAIFVSNQSLLFCLVFPSLKSLLSKMLCHHQRDCNEDNLLQERVKSLAAVSTSVFIRHQSSSLPPENGHILGFNHSSLLWRYYCTKLKRGKHVRQILGAITKSQSNQLLCLNKKMQRRWIDRVCRVGSKP